MRTRFVRLGLGLLALIGLFGLVLPDAGAGDGTIGLTVDRAAQRQREAANVQQLLQELGLNRLQARKLLPLIEQAAQLHSDAYTQQARLLPELISAFTALAAEDQLNQGFSKPVEGRTARINSEDKNARETLGKQVQALEQEAEKILTPQQRDIAQAFRPGQRRPPQAAKGNANVRPVSAVRPAPRPGSGTDAAADRMTTIRKELDSLRVKKEPQPGPVGRWLLQPPAFEPLCKVAGTEPSDTVGRAIAVYENGTSEQPLAETEKQRGEVAKLRKEINNWNLINGLYLDQPQIERIAALYDGAAPKSTKPDTLVTRPEGQKLVELEKAVEQVLNPGQRQVLADYKACLIPPKNLKDPVRVGQASDHSMIEQWLTKARKLTGEPLNKAIDAALDKEAEHFGELNKAERQKRVVLLHQVVRQAAAMSDSEFEISKAELAERIAPADRAKELRKELDELARQRGLPGKLALFMLNPEFIGQLRERGQQLAAGVEAKSADLAAGPQAENCEKGCALPPKKMPAKESKR